MRRLAIRFLLILLFPLLPLFAAAQYLIDIWSADILSASVRAKRRMDTRLFSRVLLIEQNCRLSLRSNGGGQDVRAPFFLMWLICLLPAVAVGQIISPERLFGRYQQFVWQDQHGLPQNGISEVVQTPDGYLWLAIAEGVVRFDGVRFTAFDTGNTPEIKSNNVQSLMVDRSGTLWIGTHGGGLSRYREGQFANFSTPQGLSDTHIRSLFEDKAGNLWIGTDGGGLNLFRDEKFTVYSTADGLPSNHIGAIGEDGAGNLWVGTTKGLARFEDNQFTVFTTKDGLVGNNINKIFRASTGDLWIGSSGGLNRLHDGRFTSFGASEGLKSNEIKSIAQDRDGTLWLGTNEDGLCRFIDGRFEATTTREGLIDNNIQAVYADQTGDIWLGTNGGGLAQLRAGRFSVFTSADGLPGDMVAAIFEDKAGGIWIGTDDGLCRFKDGKFTVITAPNGNALRGVSGINQDGDGNLWIISNSGDKVVNYTEGNSTVEIVRDKVFDNRAAVTLQDRTGNFWFGTSQDGLHLVQPDGRETVFTQQLIEQQERERKRIALELHDSIGQSLSVIRNRALMSLATPDKHDRIIAQMEEISEAAADSIAEVRQISHNLHPYQLEHLGLTTALETMIEAAESSSEIQFETKIEDIDDALSKEAEISLYRIMQECLNNILKHSGATKVGVSLKKNGDVVNLQIEDNGKGFETENSFKPKSGLGLTGIAERAKMLNAQYKISSTPNSGTTVSLQIYL